MNDSCPMSVCYRQENLQRADTRKKVADSSPWARCSVILH